MPLAEVFYIWAKMTQTPVTYTIGYMYDLYTWYIYHYYYFHIVPKNKAAPAAVYRFGQSCHIHHLSIPVSSLNCYCGQFINGVRVPDVPECREDNTCSISETSVGQCALEKITNLINGVVIQRYTCLEINAMEIDAVLALNVFCNISSVSADSTETLHVGCCVHVDLCNSDIQFPDESTPQTDSTPSPSTPTNSDSNGSMWSLIYVETSF